MSVPPYVPGPSTPPPPPFYGPPPPAAPRGSRTKWIVGGVVAVVALCCGGSAIIAAVSPPPAPVPAALPSVSVSAAPSPVTPSPAVSSPSAAPSSPAAVKATTAAPKPKPVTYAKVSSRAWSKIARDPSAHVGKTIVVYGGITQFDSATGNSMFRANVDGVRHSEWFDYDTNTVLTAPDPALIDDLATEDMFEAKVVVSGEFSYESTFGAELSTPELEIRSIRRIR